MDENKDLMHHVKISIAGRVYPFNLNPDQESKVRMAVEIIMSRFNEYKSRFKQADDQDILAQTALYLALRLENEAKISADSENELTNALQELNHQLKVYISNNVEK